MSRLLVQRTGVVTDFDYIAEPQPADLKTKPYKTMMVVLGSTAKGLGASGITIDQEIERLNAMIAEAKKLKIQIVARPARGQDAPRQAGRRRRALHRRDRAASRTTSSSRRTATRTAASTRSRRSPARRSRFIDDAMDFSEVVKAMYAK